MEQQQQQQQPSQGAQQQRQLPEQQQAKYQSQSKAFPDHYLPQMVERELQRGNLIKVLATVLQCHKFLQCRVSET